MLSIRRVNQATCDNCLKKVKDRRAQMAINKIAELEKENRMLRDKIEAQIQERKYYQYKFEAFSSKYISLCIRLTNLKTINASPDEIGLLIQILFLFYCQFIRMTQKSPLIYLNYAESVWQF